MTKISLMRHAVKLWQVPHVPKEINRANARKWLRSVELLGDRWLLAQPIRRQQ
jgi:hypothetical protein